MGIDQTKPGLSRLRELVEIETPTGDNVAVTRALELLRSWFDDAGLSDSELIRVDGVPHLSISGGPNPRLLLVGHVDTVFPRGTLEERPFQILENKATGPGVFDMKAGLVIMAEALSRCDSPSDVAVLITGDEELGSLTSRGLVETEARRAGQVLVLEPSLGGALKIARRGCSIYRIELHGRAAHAGLDPELGENALLELAHQVIALPRLADSELGTIVSPTLAQAGTTINVIPDSAVISVDVRAWTMSELQRIDRAISSLVTHNPEVRMTVSGGINRPPMEKERSEGLLEVARRVVESQGLHPLEALAAGGASDGNFAAATGAATLDGLGPDGGGAHASTEWVNLESFEERISLLTGIINELHAHQSA